VSAAPKGRSRACGIAQGAALGGEWPSPCPSAPLSRRPAARRSLTLQSFSRLRSRASATERDGALWAAGRAGEGKGEREGTSTHDWPWATLWRSFGVEFLNELLGQDTSSWEFASRLSKWSYLVGLRRPAAAASNRRSRRPSPSVFTTVDRGCLRGQAYYCEPACA